LAALHCHRRERAFRSLYSPATAAQDGRKPTERRNHPPQRVNDGQAGRIHPSDGVARHPPKRSSELSTTILYCKESPGLHLGPGSPTSKNVINFQAGYAELNTEDPLYAEKMSWTTTFGCPPIKVVTAEERQVQELVAAELNQRARDAQMEY